MIRHNDAIRLSAVDLTLFQALTGQEQPAPTTVVDYNRRLRAAARAWSRGASPDERLLGAIARRLLIDEHDRASVIDHDKLSPFRH